MTTNAPPVHEPKLQLTSNPHQMLHTSTKGKHQVTFVCMSQNCKWQEIHTHTKCSLSARAKITNDNKSTPNAPCLHLHKRRHQLLLVCMSQNCKWHQIHVKCSPFTLAEKATENASCQHQPKLRMTLSLPRLLAGISLNCARNKRKQKKKTGITLWLILFLRRVRMNHQEWPASTVDEK